VIIPSGVTAINDRTFQNCKSLTSVTIPDGVTRIGISAFENCNYYLNRINIPASVTTIDDRAFYNCTKLRYITVNATTPPGLGFQALRGTPSGRIIYVPAESVDTYKSASGWSSYSSNIQAITS
jgi:hypothetical protein